MPKDNLKDKLEGNELDLSLNNLTEVPVKELVSCIAFSFASPAPLAILLRGSLPLLLWVVQASADGKSLFGQHPHWLTETTFSN